MTAPRYTNIAEIRTANRDSGRFWFSPETTGFFAAKVESRVYDDGQGRRLWVESTRNFDDSAREYKIVRFDTADSDISYCRDKDSDVLRFDYLHTATDHLERHLL